MFGVSSGCSGLPLCSHGISGPHTRIAALRRVLRRYRYDGKPSPARRVEEHRKAFRRTMKRRTSSEGRISYLKRGYGWDRSRIDTTEGAPDMRPVTRCLGV